MFSTTETNKAHLENLFIISSPGFTVRTLKPGHLEEECPKTTFSEKQQQQQKKVQQINR